MITSRFVSRYPLLCVVLFLSASLLTVSVYANYIDPPFLVGTDPSKDSPASIDILEVYLTNNGTHFRFILKCRSVPTPNPATAYRVFLDTKSEGALSGTYIGADYYLEAKDVSYLYEWNGFSWKQKSPVEVQIDHNDKTISLTAKLEDIGYPGYVENTVGIVVETIQPIDNQRDRAPDTGNYTIIREDIPELPWPTPLVFVPALMATVYVVYVRKFKKI